MSTSTELCMIVTTCARASDARHLGEGLLKASLAACVQLSSIDSLFVWHGSVSREEETRVVIKTRRDLAERALDWLREAHPYDTPQLLQLDIDVADAAYADWVRETTTTG